MKPVIAITSGAISNKLESWAPVTHGQSQTYIEAVTRAGGVPFIVPILSDESSLRALYDAADGILFAGGNDLDPSLYGERLQAEASDTHPERDACEIILMNWAISDNKPFIGICRGMQLLNVVQGGSCYQDIPSDLPEASDHNSSTKRKTLEDIAHQLKIKPGSHLANILGAESIGANTHHHQAVKQLGERIIANSWSEDGLIEGIELENNRLAIGVQSHPESLDARAEIKWRRLFSALVEAARTGAS